MSMNPGSKPPIHRSFPRPLRMDGAWRFIAAILIALLLPSLAYPQVPAPAQPAIEGLRRQEERAQELQRQKQARTDALRPEASTLLSTRLPVEQPCFVIEGVELVGADAQRFPWLSDAALPFLRQCAGVAGLRQIAGALDAKLIELGYVTSRVALPRQNLKDGVLTIQLHVGRIARIGMFAADDAKTVDGAWGTWRNAMPIAEGDILNVRDIEQGLEQMKRLPRQSVAIELAPGDDADTSNVRILRQSATLAQRMRGCLTLDNSGSEALGRSQLSGCLSLDNPLGLNDILALTASSNAEHPDAAHRGQSLSLDYSVPWGYNTFSLSAASNRYAQRVQGTTAQFLSSGRSEGLGLKWHRTMLRTSTFRAGLYAAVTTRRASSYLDDVELVVQRRRTTSLETGVTYKGLLGDAALELELGYRQGVPWLHAEDNWPEAASGGLTLRPNITVLSASFSLPFKLKDRSLLYAATLRVQATPDRTLSTDQIAIGNRYSVRGFDGDSVCSPKAAISCAMNCRRH